MANDLPDYTKKIAITVTVGTEQVPVTSASESPVCEVDRYAGTDTTYQVVASWTVAADVIGYLAEVSMESSSYSKTYFKLVIGATTLFTDKTIQGPLSIPFADVQLAEGTVVRLSARSTDGTSITVDGMISGKEVG